MLPSGQAVKTLKMAASQGEAQILYAVRMVKGVETKRVRGYYSLREVLDRMLEDTRLEAVQDDKSRSYIIKPRAEKGGEVQERSENEPPIIEKTETQMNLEDTSNKKKTISVLYKRLLALAAVSLSNLSAQEDSQGEEFIHELSPFVVDASSDVGYRATQTLAGSRLKSGLRDIGSAISVVTSEFLNDTGSTSVKDVLVYTTNTEVGGIGGNFGGDVDGFINVIRRPENATRIRGLGAADKARNFYLTDIPFDTYNTNRIEIQRGPNAILFGLGQPSGVINNSLIRAEFTDSGEVGIQVDSFGSKRSTFNVNRELSDDRLAVFIAGVYEEKKFEQNPAFERNKRIYGSLHWKISENSSLVANLETGKIDANRPRPGPLNDYLSTWYDFGRPILDEWDDSRLPSPAGRNPGLHGSQGGFLFGPGTYFFDPDSSVHHPVGGEGMINGGVVTGAGAAIAGAMLPLDLLAQRYGQSPSSPLIPGIEPFGNDRAFYKQPSLTDDSIYNFRKILLEGPNSGQNSDFTAYNFTFEQRFLNGNAGIELAFDQQEYNTSNHSAVGGGRGGALHLDFNRELLGGRPNPNFGGVAVFGFDSGDSSISDREGARATAFYNLDFGDVSNSDWVGRTIGKMVFTGLLNSQKIYSESYQYADVADPIVAELQPSVATNANLWNAGTYRALPIAGLEPGQTLIDLASKGDLANIRIGGITAPQVNPSNGTYSFWNQNTQQFEDTQIPTYSQFNRPDLAAFGGSKDLIEIDSTVLLAQNYFLSGNLVTTVGWRRDDVSQFDAGSAPPNPIMKNRRVDILNPSWVLPTDPTLEANKDVWSYGGVFHMPENFMEKLPFSPGLSFHYSESSNFNPLGRRVNVENTQLGAPSGETVEEGFTISLLENKLFLKFNWYETSQNNNSDFGRAVLTGVERMLRQEIESINDPANVGIDIEDIPIPPQVIMDLMGFEFDYANLTATSSISNQVTGVSDLVAKGMEMEMSYNPKPNITFVLNVGKQNASKSNISPAVGRLIDSYVIPEMINGPYADLLVTSIPNEPTVRSYITNNVINPFLLRQYQDGGPVTEMKEWHASFIGNYQFAEKAGWLKGFGVGGAVRWQDKSSIGFPVVYDATTDSYIQDVTNPWYGPTDTKVDAWIKYSTKLSEKVDWLMQLNVRNLLNDKALVPLSTQPDGTYAQFMVPEPV